MTEWGVSQLQFEWDQQQILWARLSCFHIWSLRVEVHSVIQFLISFATNCQSLTSRLEYSAFSLLRECFLRPDFEKIKKMFCSTSYCRLGNLIQYGCAMLHLHLLMKCVTELCYVRFLCVLLNCVAPVTFKVNTNTPASMLLYVVCSTCHHRTETNLPVTVLMICWK